MNRALWAATLGYVLETLAGTAVDDDTIEAARRLFVEAVRGLGPLPTLRVGAQPYGLLPATSVRRWQPATRTTRRPASWNCCAASPPSGWPRATTSRT